MSHLPAAAIHAAREILVDHLGHGIDPAIVKTAIDAAITEAGRPRYYVLPTDGGDPYEVTPDQTISADHGYIETRRTALQRETYQRFRGSLAGRTIRQILNLKEQP